MKLSNFKLIEVIGKSLDYQAEELVMAYEAKIGKSLENA